MMLEDALTHTLKDGLEEERKEGVLSIETVGLMELDGEMLDECEAEDEAETEELAELEGVEKLKVPVTKNEGDADEVGTNEVEGESDPETLSDTLVMAERETRRSVLVDD